MKNTTAKYTPETIAVGGSHSHPALPEMEMTFTRVGVLTWHWQAKYDGQVETGEARTRAGAERAASVGMVTIMKKR